MKVKELVRYLKCFNQDASIVVDITDPYILEKHNHIRHIFDDSINYAKKTNGDDEREVVKINILI